MKRCEGCGRSYGPLHDTATSRYDFRRSTFCSRACYFGRYQRPLSKAWLAYLEAFDAWILGWRDPDRVKPVPPVVGSRKQRLYKPWIAQALALLDDTKGTC